MHQAPADAKFRRAFDAHFDAVNRYCLRRLPPDDANDAAAQVFAVAWRKAARMPEGAATLPWLYRIAHYEVSTMRRARRRRGALLRKLAGQAPSEASGPGNVVVRRAEHQAMVEALGSLSDADREIILLRSYEELSTGEIAVVLDCSRDAAKKRLSRALQRLRKAAGIAGESPSAHPSVRSRKGGDE